MWNDVTLEFGHLLGNHLYPTLFLDVDYIHFLASAGLRSPYPQSVSQLTDRQRKALADNARVKASLLGLELASLNSMSPTRAKAIELRGPLRLYRLWSSQVKGNEMRFFWFREELMTRCFHEAGERKIDRLEWLRGQLAVSYNWSHCDRVAKMELAPRDTILGVEADGLPVRGIQIGRQDRSVKLPVDYWKNFGKYSAPLPGGAAQLFLFLVPQNRVCPHW
jgi:hypothetical protein